MGKGLTFSDLRYAFRASEALRLVLSERRAFRASKCGDWQYRTRAAIKIAANYAGVPALVWGRGDDAR